MAEPIEDRFGRLLTMVPFILRSPGVTVAEVRTRFGITRAQLVADLNLLFVCGLPGYGPGDLMEAYVDGDRVWIRLADYFARPLRLTPAEGLLLYAGARAMAAAGAGDAALERAVGQLAVALGPDVVSRISVELEGAGELGTVRRALEEHRRLHLVYYAHSRDETTERDVDPWALFLSGGRWYLVGWCHSVDDERIFRLDRIREATLTDVPAPVPADVDLSRYETLYVQHAGDTPIVLDLAPQAAAWVSESYPLAGREQLPDGWVRVHLTAGGTAWLEKLLLRLGPQARVVDPPELARRTQALACRLAHRYGDAG